MISLFTKKLTMKKILISLAVVLFVLNSGFSQKSFENIQYFKSISSNIMKNLNNNLNIKSDLDIEGKICLENWELDTLDNLVRAGDGLITIESLGGNKYLITQDLLLGGESVFLTIYFNGIPDFKGEALIDSSHLYFVEGGVKSLFIKDIYTYDGEKLVFKESYADYSLFGLPVGFILSEYTNFYYDNNDFLTSEALYSFDFATSTVEFFDSTVYINNSKGLATEALYYEVDYTGVLGLSLKRVYTYNSDDLVIKEEEFYKATDWVIENRNTSEYTTSFTFILYEYTYDGGITWTPSSRDSTYFDNLPFNFYSRTVSEDYIEDAWKTYNIVIATDCTGSSTNDLGRLSFSARLDDNNLLISSDELIHNAKLQIYNLNGQVLFDNSYKTVPERITIDNLTPGMYLLNITDRVKYGITKLIKL